MTGASQQFDKEQLVAMLALLNDELARGGHTGEICIVGGSAMILAYGSRNSTRDIDALMIAPSEVRAAAARVAEEHGLPENWLNDGVKGFSSSHATEAREIIGFSQLRVLTPPPEYILSMKCIAARVGLDSHDREDARFLIHHLGLPNAAAVLEVVERYYPRARIPAKTQYFVQEICDELFS